MPTRHQATDTEVELMEDTTTPEPAAAVAVEPDTGSTDSTTDEVSKWKALARKHETQAKANADAAKRLAEIEEENKTELDKALEKATAAEQRLATLEATNRRLAAIAKHQIPGDYADLVTGSTDEELEASATKVSALIAAQTPTGTTGPLVLPSVNSGEPPALNSDALEEALRRAVGAN